MVSDIQEILQIYTFSAIFSSSFLFYPQICAFLYLTSLNMCFLKMPYLLALVASS